MAFKTLSWIEELAERYYIKKNYIVIRNLLFYVPKEQLKTTRGGWKDIDLIAFNADELNLIECTPILVKGSKNPREVAEDIVKNFKLAEYYLKKQHKTWSRIIQELKLKINYILITEQSPKSIEKYFNNFDIKISIYSIIDLIKGLIKELMKEMKDLKREGRKGREDDPVLALLKQLIQSNLIKLEQIKEL